MVYVDLMAHACAIVAGQGHNVSNCIAMLICIAVAMEVHASAQRPHLTVLPTVRALGVVLPHAHENAQLVRHHTLLQNVQLAHMVKYKQNVIALVDILAFSAKHLSPVKAPADNIAIPTLVVVTSAKVHASPV